MIYFKSMPTPMVTNMNLLCDTSLEIMYTTMYHCIIDMVHKGEVNL
jgi:hypothetical protein